jgi:spore germination protein YaaH
VVRKRPDLHVVQRLLTSTNAAEVADGPITQGWDEDALSPYVIYTKDDRQHVIYYEDARSIGFKLQLAKELNLGGVAIWALGYEDRSRELWNAFQTELTE